MGQIAYLDRQQEAALLTTLSKRRGLLVVIGRRRVGKTALLRRWLDPLPNGLYTQAIEAPLPLQLSQLILDIATKLQLPAQPNNWGEFFNLLDASRTSKIVCLDEFQYLVRSDPSLPSVIQKWLDHGNTSNSLLVLSGSSTKLMSAACLNADAPLFGRALHILKLQPLEYRYFAQYLKLKPQQPDTFQLFSLVGGIPKYWELVEIISGYRKLKRPNAVSVIDDLYFSAAAFMEGEVNRILADERIDGVTPLAVLEAIGRGAARPSEIAARLGVPQTQLPKVFELLLASGIILRDVPYGTSARNAKVVNYRLAEPAALGWFAIASTHQSRWRSYNANQKRRILDSHTGLVFEDYVRTHLAGAQRYWDKHSEIDAMRAVNGQLVVAEVKWAKLDRSQSYALLNELEGKVKASHLGKGSAVRLELYDQSFLRSHKPVATREVASS